MRRAIDISSPIGVKRIKELTEIEKDVYIVICYLQLNNLGHELLGARLPSGQDFEPILDLLNRNDWFYPKDIQKEYQKFTGKEIDIETLYQTIKDLNNTHIDFDKSKYANQSGKIELTKEDEEIVLLRGDYKNVEKLFSVITETGYGYRFDVDSRRAISAIFCNDNDVFFWKTVYDEEENIDMTFDEFIEYKWKDYEEE